MKFYFEIVDKNVYLNRIHKHVQNRPERKFITRCNKYRKKHQQDGKTYRP